MRVSRPPDNLVVVGEDDLVRRVVERFVLCLLLLDLVVQGRRTLRRHAGVVFAFIPVLDDHAVPALPRGVPRVAA